MSDVTREPVIRTDLADSGGIVLDFTGVGVMGALYIINNGPNECWMAFDGNPSAGYADGQKHLAVGESLNLDDIVYQFIGVICSGGDTAQVEAVGLIRPGGSGQGSA